MFNESGIVIIFYIQLRIDKGEANSKYFILIQKKKRFIILILPSTKSMVLQEFGKSIGDKLSFGSAELL